MPMDKTYDCKSGDFRFVSCHSRHDSSAMVWDQLTLNSNSRCTRGWKHDIQWTNAVGPLGSFLKDLGPLKDLFAKMGPF